MQYKQDYRVVTPDIEFVASPVGLLRFSHTVKPDGLEKDDNNEIWAVKGNFIDAEGKIVKAQVSGDNVTFDSDPIGILYNTNKVTYGEADASVMYQGTVYGYALPLGEGVEYTTKIGEALHKILPGINFLGKDGELVHDGVSNVQTLKTTGTKVTVSK